MRRQLLIATLVPIGLLILLFVLVGNAAIKTTAFDRSYQGNILKEEKLMVNEGIYQLKEFKGHLYGTDFRAIYRVDLPSMKRNLIAQGMSQPVVGWGFQNDSLFTCLANNKTIYYVNEHQQYYDYYNFDFIILKMFVVNDSMFLLKTHDTAFIHHEFYTWNRHTKKLQRLKDSLPNYKDGGFSTDGEFVKRDGRIVHFQCNMGKFSVIDGSRFEFSPNYTTVDRQIMPPPVVQFSSNGFRLDKKFQKINLSAFVQNDQLFLLSNAYNKREFYSGAYKNEYPIDVYNLNNGQYLRSFSVPRKDHAYGALISMVNYKDYLILLYLRKISIMNYED